MYRFLRSTALSVLVLAFTATSHAGLFDVLLPKPSTVLGAAVVGAVVYASKNCATEKDRETGRDVLACKHKGIAKSEAVDEDGRSIEEPAVDSPTEIAPDSASTSDKAKELGYDRRVKDPPFNPHGQPVFTNGKDFITPDVDQHNGGEWKGFDKRGNRTGTYNGNLDRIGK